jgi:hypothetical protein
MQLFHILTILISLAVFIGLFIYTFIVFYKKKSFPPDIPNCPDYWKVKPDGTCQIPKPGEMNLGNLDEHRDIHGKAIPSKGRQIYGYKNSTNENNEMAYSYLPYYYNPVTGAVLHGEKQSNLPLGYYQIDIPYGYDSAHPQTGIINFKDERWASFGDPYCEIKRWANKQNIQWDGIANYNCG